MTITNTLTVYGFAARRDGSLFWGEGSLVWGHTASVKTLGSDLYEVTIHHWAYDCEGDPMMEVTTTRTLYGAAALAWIFTEMPRDFWKYSARHAAR